MSEHTLGPWEFDGVCQIVEVERPHMRVCFLPSDHAEYASSKANGRLIAAAPDMLEALRIIADWDKQPLTHEHPGALIDVIRSICDRARAEIAKATQQSPASAMPESK